MNARVENRYDRLAAALELLRNGYRTRIVQAATGLPAGAIRKLCSDVLGKPATPGQLPEASSVTTSWGRYADAALFAGIYHEIGGDDIYRYVDPYLVLHAHSIYQIVREQMDRMPTRRGDERPTVMDINHAWVIARDLRAKTAVLAVCSNLSCRYHNLLVVGSHKQLACALCHAPAQPFSQGSLRPIVV
ncbi:transcriptional activator [Sulfurifustis variabilis]|uniref:Transcriptional activator n=1 Tax=Sulfurifustis variabilis TaxID=1675686 RepID=A0A1B4V7U9_9GAMM|nr:FlhC family transcriptional regulator [Sulfurifustis variabilis]BAU49598.1 transcriptional activator [Sulfurifustis variabilis]